MHKFFFNLVFIIFLQHTSCLNAQGIEFNSSDFPIINRTSYNVFEYKQPKFSGEFNIDFELKNKILNMFMIKFFDVGLEKIADAFERRAIELFKSV